MANLNGQNIGTNYKGFLNLDSTINTPLDATLRAVTDGMGTSSPFSISTAQTGIGTYTAASYAGAKLIVGNYASANSEVANIGIMAVSQATLNSATAYGYAVYGHGYTNGSARSAGLVGEGKVTVTGDTGSAIGVRGYANDTHAGGFNIGLYGDATGGSSNYALYMAAGDIYSAVTNQIWNFQTSLDFQVSGVSKVKFNSSGRIENAGDIFAGSVVYSYGANVGCGNLRANDIGCLQRFSISGAVANNACFIGGTSTFNLLQLGGTTSSFPAIKRNGAAIDFRLADDSGYCAINVGILTTSGNANINTARMTNINDQNNYVTAINITASTGKVNLLTLVSATGLPTTRPATVGDLYAATAADILANGDKVIGIRV
jgi:hypothetical protein